MPEGHTIHMFAADHQRIFGGQKIRVSSPQGRFIDANRINGKLLRDVRAHGKNLFYDFGKGRIVHVHLGLHGKFRLTEISKSEKAPEPRGAVRMRFITRSAVLDLNGPIRCEVVNEQAMQVTIDRLGPDLLDPKADASGAWQKIRKRSTPIGLLLMDQSIISGIGNAYRCELLYRQRLLGPLILAGLAIFMVVDDHLQHWPDQHWPDQYRPDQYRPDQYRPDQYRPDQYWLVRYWLPAVSIALWCMIRLACLTLRRRRPVCRLASKTPINPMPRPSRCTCCGYDLSVNHRNANYCPHCGSSLSKEAHRRRRRQLMVQLEQLQKEFVRNHQERPA